MAQQTTGNPQNSPAPQAAPAAVAKPAPKPMWIKDDLRKIAGSDDLHISPFRKDGVTYGTPTWIWSVAVGGALYVRAYNGRSSRWYQAAVHQKAGRITAAGMAVARRAGG